MSKIFWVSWEEQSEDYRPMTDPPSEEVLGWWCSGYNADDQAVICAAVTAESGHGVVNAIGKNWPGQEHLDFRFIDECDSEWMPDPGRFPLSQWMKERFDTSKAEG